MQMRARLKKTVRNWTGYSVFKHKYLPTGWDLAVDLKQKIRLPMNTIFDVGSNTGQTALTYNGNFPHASVYCFEPVKETFNHLQNAVTHLQQVKCFQLALGDEEGSMEIKIFEGKESVLNSLNPKSMNNNGTLTETITITTGDRFCLENKITEIDLLKIDTEGYEIKVLNGFRQLISAKKIKAIYCEVGFNPNNHRNTYINELIDFTRQHEFHPYGLYEVSNFQLKTGNNYGNLLFLNYDTIGKLS